jgi:hypothetical protein
LIVRRILFSVICAVSLLLFVATVAAWIRSFWFRDIVSYVSTNGNGRLIQSIRGRLHIISDLDGQSSGNFMHREDRLSPDAIWHGGMSGYPVKVEWHLGHVWQRYSRFHGFGFLGYPPNGGLTTNHRLIVIPYWSPAVLFAVMPAIWIWRFIKYGQRRKVGHCPKCNYDLRATPQRCPECGWSKTIST